MFFFSFFLGGGGLFFCFFFIKSLEVTAIIFSTHRIFIE